ncbi:MAG: hypothetical protein ACREMX_00985 [Gemmatimonadales bacterium]
MGDRVTVSWHGRDYEAIRRDVREARPEPGPGLAGPGRRSMFGRQWEPVTPPPVVRCEGVSYDQRQTIQGIDHSLRRIRFAPPASLEGELLWRLRQGGEERADDVTRASTWGWLLALMVVLGVLIFLFWVRLPAFAPGFR